MELSNSKAKTPEAEADATTSTRVQQQPGAKPPSFSNGVLKRHPSPMHLHPPLVVTYRECLKNHAAAVGGHALDGCGEFMPSPASNPADPTSLRCAACGCHRNFHRREPEDTPAAALLLPATQPVLEYRPLHRHHPPPPPSAGIPGDSPSSPPISSAYYPPSAHHMLLTLSQPPAPGVGGPPVSAITNPNPSGRRRFRTKLTRKQKEKMLELAERVGWKMQKKYDGLISGFCGEIGVEKVVFKVWMHNNKNSMPKKDHFSNAAIAPPSTALKNDDSKENVDGHNRSAQIPGTNDGSPSSS